MKILIVFLAILILNISFLTYQGDLGRYLRLQNTVKAIAEECGAGAALFFDSSQFAEGYLIARPEEGQKHIAYILAHSQPVAALSEQGSLNCQVIYFDDSLQSRTYLNGLLQRVSPFTFPFYYTDEQNRGILVAEPSVIVTITLVTEDLFRLPYLETTEVTRSAMYELRSENH